MVRLAELAVGQQARVSNVDGSDETSARLLEMGLVPGTELQLIGLATLGDPLEIELLGYRLSIRKSEAHRVSVELI